MSSLAPARDLIEGWKDLIQGARMWRISHLLGGTTLRQRYARSQLGQIWIVLTTAITTTAFGLVWSQLWGRPIHDFLPWVAISHIVWGLITSNLLDATGALPATGRYFLTHEAPFSTVIYGTIYRNFMVFLHNTPIIIAVLLIFPQPVDWTVLYAIPGLVLALISCVNLTYLIALICTRFRDVAQLVGSALQIMYFLTPVMWQPEFLGEEHHWLIDYNPLNALLCVIRDPLLGREVTPEAWTGALVTTAVSLLLGPLLIGAFRKRIIYWV